MSSIISLQREVLRLQRSAAQVPPEVEVREGFELTRRWYDLRPHPVQLAYWLSPHRFNTLPCGRRSGKSELAKRRLAKRAVLGTQFDSPRFGYGAPTRDQAKRIAWDDLKRLVPTWAQSGQPNETDLTIPLWHGGTLEVFGMDRPERVEGAPLDGIVLDEYANMKQRAWTDHVRPALSDRAGWCDFIGVPEGRNHYYELDRAAKALMLERGESSDWGSYHWRSEDILPAAEIAAAKEQLDELTYEQEYGGSFVTFQGRAYHAFDEALHCRRLFDRYNPKGILILCFDFNVSPGVAAVAQEMELPDGGTGTGWIGEVWIPQNSNTPAVCRKLLQDWGSHEGPVRCYGDATGGARGTAKVQGSDWDLILDILRGGDSAAGLAGFGDRVTLEVPEANPPERSRVNAVNSRLKSSTGTVRMVVDPSRAPHLQKDFEGVVVLQGGSGELDKKGKDKRGSSMLTHISDAAGYYVAREFPIAGENFTVSRFRVR